MAKTKAKTRTKVSAPPPKTKVDFPNVKPSSLSERNAPSKPTTLRVCGNVIPVINGKAAEANPKILRRRAKEAARRRGGDIDETRI